MAKSRRTTHRSSAGKKLYAVRDASGKFKDIQTYERAHRQDLKTKSTSERAKAAKRGRTAKKSAKKR
jgi:DNA-binding protein HU-beta